jgi:hypothetical protein
MDERSERDWQGFHAGERTLHRAARGVACSVKGGRGTRLQWEAGGEGFRSGGACMERVQGKGRCEGGPLRVAVGA